MGHAESTTIVLYQKCEHLSRALIKKTNACPKVCILLVKQVVGICALGKNNKKVIENEEKLLTFYVACGRI